MKKVISALLVLVMVLSLSAIGVTAAAAEPETDSAALWNEENGVPEPYTGRTKPLTITFGTLGSLNENDIGKPWLDRFTEVLDELTGGMIQVEPYANGSLGGEPDMLDQVISGTLDMASPSANVIASIIPSFYCLNLPFAFMTLDNYWEVLAAENHELVDVLREVVADTELFHMIDTGVGTVRGCQNTTRPIRSPEDFKGLTFRIMAGEIYKDIFESLGATISTLSFAELYTGLQQGVVQGEDLGVSMYYDQNFYNVEPYASELNMVYCVNPLIISNDCWDKLSPEEKVILSYASAEGQKACYQEIKDWNPRYYEEMEAVGCTVIRNSDLTDAERQAFLDATAGVWEKYSAKTDPRVFDVFNKCAAEARENGMTGIKWWDIS